MRLGESLIARGSVDPAGLARALDEQPLTGKRIGSLLIARGLAEPDEVARALGEHHGVPAVLARHLAARDPALASLITAEHARANMLVPIARARGGELIVCARDPRPALVDPLEDMVDGIVMLAVAPADAVEAIVLAVYGSAASDEIDIEVETGPVPRLDPDGLDGVTSGMFALVGLDDERVTKDPTQSGAIKIPGGRATTPSTPPRTHASPSTSPMSALLAAGKAAITPAPAASAVVATAATAATAATVNHDDLGGGWAIGAEPLPEPAVPLVHRLAELEHAATRDAATDSAMKYVATRWVTSVLFTIKEGAACGHRGHGATADAIEAATFPLTAPSMLKVAHDTGAAATERPARAGMIQDRFARLLGQPATPIVAPILVGTRVVGLLAVGDARAVAGGPAGAAADAFTELGQLADALGDAYARILRAKR